ncbi:MAG: Gfo/Idh/MocA family oxidoreductase, partial [Chloroflexi bacterium]|nr:Gfo/Idh/MocA family oxidoreductase [Chloroflexota bacterium]
MSDNVRVAIIGTGWWATFAHIPGLIQHESAELVALCDKDIAKAEKTAVSFSIDKAYDDVNTMLANERLDAVIVATNHASHYQVTKPCLELGLHVLIEKPMTLYAAEAKELVALAKANHCEISIGYNANYSPHAQRARALLQSGVLGPVQYISGIFNQHIIDLLRGKGVNSPSVQDKVHSPGAVYSDPLLSGGGHGHLQITHLAGMLSYLTGLRAHSVSARMSKHGLNVDLVNAIMIEFESGVLGVIGGTGNMPGGRKIDLQIYCAEGWIDIDDVAGIATIQG